MNFIKVCIRRMSDRYRAAADFARPEKEMSKDDSVSTTTLLARWDHTYDQRITSCLCLFVQFCMR